MSGVQRITISAEDADQRLDRWLKRLFPHLSQIRIEKMCRKGELRVDGARCKPATRIEAGQEVRIPPIPAPEHREERPKQCRISDQNRQMIQDAVIYMDDHLIVLNKPAGLPSQGGSKQVRHVDGLAEALKYDRDEKPRLVHRLDKDTSGLLLLARSRSVAATLSDALRHRETRKIYWAAVAGVPVPQIGTIKYGFGGSGQENLGDGWGAQFGGDISKKLHLHARYLRFEHPVTKKTFEITADLSHHMQRTWETFQWDVNDVPDDPFEEL
ncbi:MAG: RluA family pseudouridine synthase [Rhodobacteraceae bacterium]|nr:RluA family pseudouridine synthase [Paracoccaceae bacterium]